MEASQQSTLGARGKELARAVARRFGYEIHPAGAAMPGPDPSQVSIPRGRDERFEVEGEYEVLPRGRYDVVARNYYSPIPDLEQLPEDIWDRRSAAAGVDLKLDRAMETIEGELAPFIAELDVPLSGPAPPGQFFLRNENYEAVDAELLYAMVRSRKPRRVLELGSGYTTLLIGDACRRNAAEGRPTEHIAFDPYPRAHIVGDGPPEPTVFEPISANDVPLDRFSELGTGDILFVDTTHTVKLGSDVNHIVLDILPSLASGVLVHFHDIFIPWEYPRGWFEEMQYYWAEQYLLQAFLAFNDSFEVVLPAMAVAREFPERLGAVVPSLAPGTSPGAFWIVRR